QGLPPRPGRRTEQHRPLKANAFSLAVQVALPGPAVAASCTSAAYLPARPFPEYTYRRPPAGKRLGQGGPTRPPFRCRVRVHGSRVTAVQAASDSGPATPERFWPPARYRATLPFK